jgi:hypothetical protein
MDFQAHCLYCPTILYSGQNCFCVYMKVNRVIPMKVIYFSHVEENVIRNEIHYH